MDGFKGIIFLGAYIVINLIETKLKILSFYGSKEKVLNMKKYTKYKTLFPKDLVEFVIEGGCHSYFPMYGI